MYKYGMYVKTIARIKKDIVNGMVDEDVQSKYSLTDGQLGFIHDTLLKGAYKKINNHEKRLLSLERKMVNSTTKGFGLGVVVEELGKDPGGTEWVRVHFNGRKLPTLVNKTKESFSLTDGTSGKVTFL